VFVKIAFALLSCFVALFAVIFVLTKNWLFLSLLLGGFIALHVGTFLRLHAKYVHVEEGGPEPANSKASSQ
jgi:hypothetical protein